MFSLETFKTDQLVVLDVWHYTKVLLRGVGTFYQYAYVYVLLLSVVPCSINGQFIIPRCNISPMTFTERHHNASV